MYRILQLTLAVSILILLSGCQTQPKLHQDDNADNQQNITGVVLQSQFKDTEGKVLHPKVGNLAGSIIDNKVKTKTKLTDYDKNMIMKTAREALEFSPPGSKLVWKNEDNNTHGSITPTRTFKENNSYCREYIQEVFIGSTKQKTNGKACRQEDGNWEIIK